MSKQQQRRAPAPSKKAQTPIRAALVPGSSLLPLVEDGITALRKDRQRIAESARDAFADSLALDEALKPGHEQDNRWDYLLGHLSSGQVVGLEPHSASTNEISRVIQKKKAAQDQLRSHLKTGTTVAHWFWVASGRVDFVPFDKAKLRLDNDGITFVGKELLSKHLAEIK